MTHPIANPAKTAIILSNLGTPSAPTPAAVKRYLRQFLSDPRVVEIPKVAWQILLNAVVLPIRAKQSARLYQSIWQKDGSPLLTHSQALVDKLTLSLKADYPDAQVFLGMRYGEPALSDLLQQLSEQYWQRLIIVPMYPQYASATTGSTLALAYQHLSRQRRLPTLHTLHSYHDHPAYIEALAESVRSVWQREGQAMLVMSFHGIPKRSLNLGDPYFCLCQKTGRLVAEALQLSASDYRIVFQSRFGKAEWLQPYCDQTLAKLPGEGVKQVDVICPGFAVDCLETLEEIAVQNRQVFLTHGGERYRYIPCLNASDAQVSLYRQLLLPFLD